MLKIQIIVFDSKKMAKLKKSIRGVFRTAHTSSFGFDIAPLSRLQIESAIFYCNVDMLNRAESILPLMVSVKVGISNPNHIMLLYCYVI